MDNFWQYFFGFLTAMGAQWFLNRQQTRTLERKVDTVGSKVATTVTGSQERTQIAMKANGEEVKKEVRDLANGGPNGLKAQIRQVLQEFVTPGHLDETEQSCPLMKAIARNGDKKPVPLLEELTDLGQTNKKLLEEAIEREARHAKANREHLASLQKRLDELAHVGKVTDKEIPISTTQESK